MTGRERIITTRELQRKACGKHYYQRALWQLLKYLDPFNPEVFRKEVERMKSKQLARLQTMAATFNYHLMPNP